MNVYLTPYIQNVSVCNDLKVNILHSCTTSLKSGVYLTQHISIWMLQFQRLKSRSPTKTRFDTGEFTLLVSKFK